MLADIGGSAAHKPQDTMVLTHSKDVTVGVRLTPGSSPAREVERSASPFWSLPPELRNRIYELLFIHPDPICVAIPTDGQKPTLHRRIGDENDGLSHPRQKGKMFWAMLRQFPVSLMAVNQPGIALFQVSRQSYAEASSVFYKNKIFNISRNCMRRQHRFDISCNYITEAGVPWMKNLGSRLHLLRKLELDFNAICPSDCTAFDRPIGHVNSGPIQLGDILCLIWRFGLRLELTIMEPNREVLSRYASLTRVQNDHSTSVPSNLSILELNRVIIFLQRNDLDIKKFWRTISKIALDKNGRGGSVVYRTTPRHDRGFFKDDEYSARTHYFSVPRNDRLVMHKKSTLGLSKMPEHIHSRIWNYVIRSQETWRLRVDNIAAVLRMLRPVYSYRRVFLDFFKRGRIKMGACDVEFTSLGRFAGVHAIDRLRALLWMIYGSALGLSRPAGAPNDLAGWPDMKVWPEVKFKLVFELEQFEPLENLRLDIMPVLHATLNHTNDETLAVELQYSQRFRHHAGVLDLGHLRRAVFAAWVSHRHTTLDHPLPRVWVNGHGEVIELVSANGTLDDEGFVTSGDWSDAREIEHLTKESTEAAQDLFRKLAKYCEQYTLD
ncbi:hypothetical protein FB567DRAFT_603683 [Paraphoma chrysanthemicola]|uniref:F-box domain-containing protein n=1 Tax=Paraphoma chrysanthemicola TaxID=798071 RepID=A0A8K0R458_9PLEO|nr:hypothetical protein FB567DRAFT_603683 [Paraphoma chrysanthemicola]